jgi:predicted nucleotide-binding protein (sugar kinase/HSP70/actin superfamily)
MLKTLSDVLNFIYFYLQKQRKHKKKKPKHEKSEDEQLKQLKESNGFDDIYIKYLDHDGHSERPGGAVLSLTLGVIILAALSVLIGCRMRRVGRRSRRHGKLHSEPDFLVNGMYL